MYKIVSTNGHYTVYINNKFYCTSDTWDEAAREINEYYERMHKGKPAEGKSTICLL